MLTPATTVRARHPESLQLARTICGTRRWERPRERRAGATGVRGGGGAHRTFQQPVRAFVSSPPAVGFDLGGPGLAGAAVTSHGPCFCLGYVHLRTHSLSPHNVAFPCNCACASCWEGVYKLRRAVALYHVGLVVSVAEDGGIYLTAQHKERQQQQQQLVHSPHHTGSCRSRPVDSDRPTVRFVQQKRLGDRLAGNSVYKVD